MSPPSNPRDAGLLHALRQVRDGHVHIRHWSDLITDNGDPLPADLLPFVDELFDHGHIALDNPQQRHGEQAAKLTEAGRTLLAELEATAPKDIDAMPDYHEQAP